MMTASLQNKTKAVATNRSTRHWFLVFSVFFGVFVSLPFLAPVFMLAGWEQLGRTIYIIYSFFCHQLPQRSYFLFGRQGTYSLPEIQTAWKNTLNPLILRQFIGNQEMGWKVAWSDRMVSMYTSIWLLGILWWPFRRRLRPLPWWGLVILMLLMAMDGTSHFFSDLFGIGQGFRDNNNWLAILTNYSFGTHFYSSDAWGSFNSIMRLLTGFLFGVGIVWCGFPYLDKAFYSPKPRMEGNQNFARHIDIQVSSHEALEK